MWSTISFSKITISCTKIFVVIYFHILTQYKPIIGRISVCHSISIRIIIFCEVGFFMSYDINNYDKTCSCCCLNYFKFGTNQGIQFLLMSLKLLHMWCDFTPWGQRGKSYDLMMYELVTYFRREIWLASQIHVSTPRCFMSIFLLKSNGGTQQNIYFNVFVIAICSIHHENNIWTIKS